MLVWKLSEPSLVKDCKELLVESLFLEDCLVKVKLVTSRGVQRFRRRVMFNEFCYLGGLYITVKKSKLFLNDFEAL